MCIQKRFVSNVQRAMQMAARKRKRVVLTLENKLCVLDRLAKGEKASKVASEFGIGNSTVTDLKKNESKILSFVSSIESLSVCSNERKIMRLAEDEKVDEAVYLWYVQKRSQGIPITGPVLREKAQLFHQQLQCDKPSSSFQASTGWQWRFCQRHGIRQLTLQGEKLSCDSDAPAPFREKLLKLIEDEGFTLQQIYNSDETGLYYRMLPEKTLAARSEKEAPGMKNPKERITLMACSNATGTHKLPLMFIGKAQNPRCLKNVNKSALPVTYYAQKNAWVDSEIFTDWFHKKFVPAVKKHIAEKNLPVKVLLLLDNAPAHPDEGVLVSADKSVKAMFLPPNTTALIQPMDQGVLEALKRRYRKSLLRKLLLLDQEGDSMISFVKKINVKDVIYMTAKAWDDIPPLTLSKSWLKLLGTHHEISEVSDGNDQDQTCEDLARQLDSNLSDSDISEWIGADGFDPGYQILTDQDIIEQIACTDPQLSTESDSESEESTCHIPTNGEAMEMLDKCLTWYECQSDATPTSIMLLKGIRDLAAKKRYASLKQLTLDSYISKDK